MDLFDVGTWQRRWRIAFVLTLPASGPLYLLACAVAVCAALAVWAVASIACGVVYLWVGKGEWEHPTTMAREKSE